MPDKVRWGVLSTSNFAQRLTIPAMQKSEWCEIRAIASRNQRNAEEVARKLGIPKAYGSYEELLSDPEIEAIYNPLPNHLHVPWSIKAAEAGKHVLCEKPLSVTVAEAQELLRAQNKACVKIGEAFMVKTNPQWMRARELVRWQQHHLMPEEVQFSRRGPGGIGGRRVVRDLSRQCGKPDFYHRTGEQRSGFNRSGMGKFHEPVRSIGRA